MQDKQEFVERCKFIVEHDRAVAELAQEVAEEEAVQDRLNEIIDRWYEEFPDVEFDDVEPSGLGVIFADLCFSLLGSSKRGFVVYGRCSKCGGWKVGNGYFMYYPSETEMGTVLLDGVPSQHYECPVDIKEHREKLEIREAVEALDRKTTCTPAERKFLDALHDMIYGNDADIPF